MNHYTGKRIDNGRWVYGSFMADYIHHKSGASIVQGGVIWYEVDPETVGQFTGFELGEHKLYRHTVLRLERDSDDGTLDCIQYMIVEWISEWGIWALLDTYEFRDYRDSNYTEGLDESLLYTYLLDDVDKERKSEKLYYVGQLKDHPEVLTYGRIEDET